MFGGLGMTLLIPAVFTESFAVLVACFAVATFAYAAFSTVILNLPADIYPTGSVASVSGLGGTAAGVGTIAAIYLTGWVSRPVLVRANPARRERRAAGRNGGDAAAGSEHEGVARGNRQ